MSPGLLKSLLVSISILGFGILVTVFANSVSQRYPATRVVAR